MRLISYAVMVYMLAALIWWSILLYRKNDQIHSLQLDNFDLAHKSAGGGETKNEFYIQELSLIKKDLLKSQKMVIGEALVFGFSLILGLFFIQKSYKNEVRNTKKQQNFLLSITHELRSPIAAINLIAETLLKRNLKQEQSREMHEDILLESNRLEKLINNLLLATRIDNKYQYTFERIDIMPLVKQVISSLQRQYSNSIITSFDQNILIAEVDQEAIKSVFYNLLENAIKYSPKENPIKCTVSAINNDVIINIADTGIGIPDKEKQRIFDQFYRIGNENTRQTKGTGLGLYIVGKIIKAHKGKINLIDNKPNGSIFSVIIPKISNYAHTSS